MQGPVSALEYRTRLLLGTSVSPRMRTPLITRTLDSNDVKALPLGLPSFDVLTSQPGLNKLGTLLVGANQLARLEQEHDITISVIAEVSMPVGRYLLDVIKK